MELKLPVAFLVIFSKTFQVAQTQTDKEYQENQPAEGRIVGGYFVNIEDYPFMAGIIVKDSSKPTFHCGCSIIAMEWVLSAAHCLASFFRRKFAKQKVYVSSGSTSWSSGNKHDIISWTYHDKFDVVSGDNDIALIRVKQSFNKMHEKPMPLVSEAYKYRDGDKVSVIGWGLKSFYSNDIELSLRKVDVYIFNQTYCANLYREIGERVTSTMFCAGSRTGEKDACKSDSGGPVFIGNALLGIVSWGIGCGKKNRPGVYTRVNLYRKWIVKTAKKLGAPLILKDASELESYAASPSKRIEKHSPNDNLNIKTVKTYYLTITVLCVQFIG